MRTHARTCDIAGDELWLVYSWKYIFVAMNFYFGAYQIKLVCTNGKGNGRKEFEGRLDGKDSKKICWCYFWLVNNNPSIEFNISKGDICWLIVTKGAEKLRSKISWNTHQTRTHHTTECINVKCEGRIRDPLPSVVVAVDVWTLPIRSWIPCWCRQLHPTLTKRNQSKCECPCTRQQ